MVTLRRDIAAGSRNRVFDNAYRNSTMTDYDLFMEQKEESQRAKESQRKKLFSREKQSSEDKDIFFTDSQAFGAYNYFGNPEVKIEEPKEAVSKDEYKSYLISQLNRHSPEKLLTKEEFYSQKFFENKNENKNSKEEKTLFGRGRQKITKNGKVFVAVYVLVVAVVASIILMVNQNYKPSVVDASSVKSSASEIRLSIDQLQ